MSKRILACWIGNTDLRASRGEAAAGEGPIGQALEALRFDHVLLLSDYSKAEATSYVKWLTGRTDSEISLRSHKLPGPTDFGAIYKAASEELGKLLQDHGRDAELTFHLSPGTPAMAAVWILLAKTYFHAELIESSREYGVKASQVPFDISAEFIPELLRHSDQKLGRLALGTPDECPEFSAIIHRSPQMKRVVEQARRVAVRSIPVLVEGESGTGKELLARAIHRASPRANKPFIAVNCGAIPADLVESEFFGHKKGAFTGAVTDRLGHFEQAQGGTLFLDEIGELPKPVQVKLLRALQEQEVTRIGDSVPRKVDARIIAATNQNLLGEVAAGRFREDLFFRLAVAVLKLPPLRERAGDIGLLLDHVLERINLGAREEVGYVSKIISVSARNIMLRHSWPGNVRELQNTLQRAVVWSDEKILGDEDIQAAILDMGNHKSGDTLLNKPIQQGVDLQKLMSELARHYLSRALVETRGNKSEAARLLQLPSYQTLTNWIEKYGVK